MCSVQFSVGVKDNLKMYFFVPLTKEGSKISSKIYNVFKMQMNLFWIIQVFSLYWHLFSHLDVEKHLLSKLSLAADIMLVNKGLKEP